jgi:hypothetical protein
MLKSHRIRALFVAALAVLGMGISPLPAQAATLTITSLSCESTGTAVLCEGWVSGGTPAYTYAWNPTGRYQWNYPDHSMNSISCGSGTLQVAFTVRDRLGATASKTITAYCGRRY